MQADVVTGGQGQTAADLAGEVGQRPARVVQHVENLVGARQQGASGLGQADLATEAIEQAHAQLLLQAGDTLAHGRLGQVQALAGFGKAAGFGNGDKGVEVGEIHKSGSGLEAAGHRRILCFCLRPVALWIPFWNPLDEKYEFELFVSRS